MKELPPPPATKSPEFEAPNPPAQPTNHMAIAGASCSLVGIVLGCGTLLHLIDFAFGLTAFVWGTLGVIFSSIGLSQSRSLPNHRTRRIALAGIFLGVVALALAVNIPIFLILFRI